MTCHDCATPSLRRALVNRLIGLQAVLLAIFVVLLIATLWAVGHLPRQRDDGRVFSVLQNALTRGADGGLELRPTGSLSLLRRDSPDVWFTIRDETGHSLSEGVVPREFAGVGPALDGIGKAKLGWDRGSGDDIRHLSAEMKRVNTAAGNVQIIATSEAPPSTFMSMVYVVCFFLAFSLPGLGLMALATLVGTPLVIRHTMASLDDAARQAGDIDINRRGTRLATDAVPAEIVPFVGAINDALGRLDDGHARYRRFLADAAHELRTPIAILNTRLEALPQGQHRRELLEDVARVATLTEQLLDLQRLEHHLAELSPVNLVRICTQVVADLAPMAIAAGYEISLQTDEDRIEAWGDPSALERAVVNLVQNAIQHGGRRGAIVVTVEQPATITITDQGAGVPPAQRVQIFEPFYRLGSFTRGAGLGLSLVRETIRFHRGEVSVVDGPEGGARFRIVLPPLAGVALG